MTSLLDLTWKWGRKKVDKNGGDVKTGCPPRWGTGVKTNCPSSENFIRGIMNDAGKQAALCSRVPKRDKEKHPFFRIEECVHSEKREDALPHKAAGVVGENCAKT